MFLLLKSRAFCIAAAAILAAQSYTPLSGQMQPCARLDGDLLPIVSCDDDSLHVLKDGEKLRTFDQECHIRPGTAFGDGFVEITDVRADLNPLRDATPAERAKAGATRFHFQANLAADRTLSNCYALLSFITEGSIGTKLIPIGRLSANKPKAIEIKLPDQVDSFCTVHVFSNTLEIRSNQHREAYDVSVYYAGLLKNVHVLSAVELLKSENVYAHKLSIDGRYLIALRLRDAKKILLVYNLQSMKLVCEVQATDYNQTLQDLTWISDHEVVYVAQTEDTNHPSRFDLYLLDVNTGQTKIIYDHVWSIVASLPEKPEVLILNTGGITEKFNVHDGKHSDRQDLVTPTAGGYTRLFDRNGNDRLFVSYKGDKITYSFRATPGAPWRELDDIVKQPGLHFNLSGPQILDRVVDVHSIGPDGDTLYISTRLGGSDRFELAAFSMSEGVIKRTIAKHPKYDLTTGDYRLAQLLFAKNSPQLIGMIYEAQKPQVVWLDPRYAAVQKSMDQNFPDHFNMPIDWSKDCETFIYFSTSDQDPGTYYVYKPTESRLIPLLELGEHLKGKTLAKTEPIEFTSRDGQKIPAYVTRPTNPGEGPTPLIVSIHGGPMARDSWRFDAENQFFASRGYMILQVNYRGSSGYGASFQTAGLKSRLDTVVLDDIADGVRFLIGQKAVDPDRIAIMGGSFGGWATYMSLIKYPELYRAGIAIAAVSNWQKAMQDDRWTFENKLAYTFWKSLLSQGNFAANEKFIDPYLRSAELKQPIFVIHGEYDDVVSPLETKMMLDALKKHNPDVQARSFAHASHTYWSFEDRVVMLNEISYFLNRNLGKPNRESHLSTAALGASGSNNSITIAAGTDRSSLH